MMIAILRLLYSFRVNDGVSIENVDDSGCDISFTFATPGEFDFECFATDEEGNTASFNQTVVVTMS